MKKVGVITISRDFVLLNYGTFFQHYALRQFIESQGFKACRYPDEGEPAVAFAWIWEFVIKILLRTPVRFFRGIDYHVWRGLKSSLISILRHLRFLGEYMTLFGRFYDCRNFVCDFYVIGSDQVWTNSSPHYYVVDNDKVRPRIAYAASADWKRSLCNDKWKMLISTEVSKFVGVSCREKIGCEIVKHLSRIDVFHAMDPVFLLSRDDYLNLAFKRSAFQNPTLLCYLVNLRDGDDDVFCTMNKLADGLNVAIEFVAIQGAERVISFSSQSIPSPSKFLSYIRDAKYVVTNSFHGAALSLVFGKRFCYLEQREINGSSQNIRVKELLDKLNMSDVILPWDAKCDDMQHMLMREYNNDFAYETIARWGEESRSWLATMLLKASGA